MYHDGWHNRGWEKPGAVLSRARTARQRTMSMSARTHAIVYYNIVVVVVVAIPETF